MKQTTLNKKNTAIDRLKEANSQYLRRLEDTTKELNAQIQALEDRNVQLTAQMFERRHERSMA